MKKSFKKELALNGFYLCVFWAFICLLLAAATGEEAWEWGGFALVSAICAKLLYKDS